MTIMNSCMKKYKGLAPAGMKEGEYYLILPKPTEDYATIQWAFIRRTELARGVEIYIHIGQWKSGNVFTSRHYYDEYWLNSYVIVPISKRVH